MKVHLIDILIYVVTFSFLKSFLVILFLRLLSFRLFIHVSFIYSGVSFFLIL